MGIQVYHVTISEVEKISGFIQSDMKHTVWSHTPSQLIHPNHANNDDHMTSPLFGLRCKWRNLVVLEDSFKCFIQSNLETSTQHNNTRVQCYFNLESHAVVVFCHALLAIIKLLTWNSNSFYFLMYLPFLDCPNWSIKLQELSY
jgi:hypothetical protein